MSSPPDRSPAAADPTSRGYHAFEDPVHDRLFGVILTLGAEVWSLRDRLNLLESALADQGIAVSALIEELALDPERAHATAADRDAFLARFLRAISADG
ncbi:MAG: hypothetical protein OXI50_01265 [Gammaproteobacteria bacterium]|nr:hypothetical protein [Gammaproteobacteria bacterium]MYB25532.1 hypothetical protein [Acidimicrobiia bacterium]